MLLLVTIICEITISHEHLSERDERPHILAKI